MKSQEYREIDLDSYMFRIINFTNSATDLTLPKLEEIFNLIDLKNISRLQEYSGSLRFRQVCEIVFPMIDKVTVEEEGVMVRVQKIKMVNKIQIQTLVVQW